MTLRTFVSTALVGLVSLSAAICQDPKAGQDPQGGIPACEDMQTTESGLQWGVLKKGNEGGASPTKADRVEVHYTGWLTDGTKFDSSRDRGETTTFGVTQVIAGWTEGLQLMTEGMRCKFVIPGDLAYGPQGRRPTIPPNATLVFDVELIKVIVMPKMREADPDAQKQLENGITLEVVKPGTGAQVDKAKGLTMRYAVWRPDGQLLACTEMLDGDKIAGPFGETRSRLGPLPFVDALAESCKVGEILRFEVPQSVWQRAGGDTVWELEVLSVNTAPTFRALDKEKIVSTDSGLKYEVLANGEGDAPKATDTVVAHYTGWLTDGTMFDSSHVRGEPTAFGLNQVIPGWTEGLQLMKPGGKFLFEIPSELGYGARSQGKIKPNSTLIFLVELVEVK